MITDLVREYHGAQHLAGPILIVEGIDDARSMEMVEIVSPGGDVRLGQVQETAEGRAVVQLFSGSDGLHLPDLTIRLRGRPFATPVGREMLGRVLDGLARPRDGLPAPVPETRVEAGGTAINPAARAYPRQHIETGISAIDGMNTLVRGQKLPIFSGNGLPHDELAAQVATHARAGAGEEDFAIVLAAMGVSHDTAERFRDALEGSGALEQSTLFLNLADDPPIERLITPRAALSLAEFLAFVHGMHLLVILTDMTNYGEALREVANRRGEIPTRKGFPGYLYSDLASLYERCGRIAGREGSITIMPMLTMPSDDITHPIPDLTGYITEGQIVLDRDLDRRGVDPPINVLPSLSRLMKDGIGEDETRADHQDVANQLYAAYSEVTSARSLAQIIGEDDLPGRQKRYLRFGEAFEQRFLNQPRGEGRTMTETLDLAWRMLDLLPREELTRIDDRHLDAHHRPQAGGAEAIGRSADTGRPDGEE
ncbi:V-type ATP synthase subunit B [bacterium]|nr:V-type ATP synthase subunit B [bacterium]